jgi:hypothetical protein
MARAQFTNNATSTLLAGINTAVTSMSVASGHGARFPVTGTNYFYCTLAEGALIEIVKVTTRATDTFTIVRAQDGTTAQSFTTAATVKLNLTAAGLAEFITTGDVVLGVNGGTGIANTGKTLTLGGNIVTTGSGAATFAFSNAPFTYTFPVATGTLADIASAQTLTTKTIALGSNTFSGTIAQFNTACTDQDFATLAGTETLTNKTITGTLETKVAMGANDISLIAGNFFTKTISGATTLTVSSVPAAGTTVSFILDLTNGGSATVTWWTGMKWAGGTAPTLTTAGRDVLGFFTHDGGTIWSGLVLAKDIK